LSKERLESEAREEPLALSRLVPVIEMGMSDRFREDGSAMYEQEEEQIQTQYILVLEGLLDSLAGVLSLSLFKRVLGDGGLEIKIQSVSEVIITIHIMLT
jgi:ATP-dependent helicase/DNAse subunit B